MLLQDLKLWFLFSEKYTKIDEWKLQQKKIHIYRDIIR